MSALLDSLREIAGGTLPEGFALPGPRDEAWKYTSLRALQQRRFAPAHKPSAQVDGGRIAHIPAPRIVLVNGMPDAALSDLSGLATGVQMEDVTDARNAADPRAAAFLQRRYDAAQAPFPALSATAAHGLVVRVDDDVDAGTLHLVQLGVADGEDRAWQLRHFIELRRGARLTLVEHLLHADAHAHLDNSVLQAHVAQGAQLTHLRVQDDAPGAICMLRTDAVLAREAIYRRVDLELGGGLCRHELNVRLEGADAHVQANGVLLADGRRHVETRLGIEHIAGDTRSTLRWRGLAGGRGRVVFHGGIRIRPGADGSIADLQNRNLLLSDGAEIDTQPVLEIDTDEVQAAHGATVGQLDPLALFYLRSRGIDLPSARAMLTAAFAREVLQLIDDEGLREIGEAALQRAFARLGA